MSEPALVAVGGGRGFIGRALASALAGRGAAVHAFGREGMSLAPGTEVQALIWAGGLRERDEAGLHEGHVAAPRRALEEAAARGLRRLVYLSSAEVYGAQEVPYREDQPRLGATAYAAAKIRGEDMAQETAARLGLRCFVVRPGVVYGPGQGPGMLLPSALAALRGGRRLATTPGRQTRDFMHVRDLVELVLRCLGPDAPAGLYNGGTGVETTIAAAICGLAERVGRADLVDLGALPYREGEVMRYVLDPSRARARLGFVAGVELARGLDELVACPEVQAHA